MLATRTSLAAGLTARALTSSLRASPALTRPRFTITPRYKSTMAEIVSTTNAPAALGPYSQAIKTPSAIYLSGQIPLTPEGVFIQGTIGEKTAQCLKNLKAVVEAAGSEFGKIVKVNIFLANMDDFAELNAEYEKWLTHKPARSCVAVKTLPKGVDVEIEAIALP